MEENKKQLYDFLIGEGLFEGTDKSFDSMYSDDDGINFLYKSLSETGYYNGSDKDFKDQFFTPKKKDLTWSQDFGKAYESMPQGSPSGTKSPTTPSASTSPKREFSLADEVIAGIDVMHPFAGAILSRNKASASELKAEERFANYTNAVKNINGRIEKSTVAADQLVKQYEALGAEMNQLNQIITSKLTPQAEKTLAALRGKQIEAQGDQIQSQIAGLKSNYETDVNRKNFLFKAAIDQKAIIENKVNDDFSFAKHFSITTFGLIIKLAGSAIEGFGDLTEMARTQRSTDEKITDKIGTDLANIGSAIYDEAQGRVPEAAQWRPEMGLKELTPFRTAVFATNAIASITPSILAALSGSKTATITTSAIMNFGDAYDVAKQRGFSDEKAALVAAAITVPVTMSDQLGLNQILKANKNAFSQFVKTETLKRLAGKELSKDAIFAVSKEVFTEGLKRFGKTAGKIVALEVPTEAAQGAMQEAGIQLADKQKLDYAKLGYATEAEALGGFFGAGAMSLGASYKAMRFNPTAYGVAMGTKNAEFAADLQEMIAQEVKTGNLTEEQAQEVTQNIKTIVETDAIIPSTVTNLDARINAINLVGEKNALMQEMEGMEPAMVVDKKERIKQIEAELTFISKSNFPVPQINDNSMYSIAYLDEASVPKEFKDRAKKTGNNAQINGRSIENYSVEVNGVELKNMLYAGTLAGNKVVEIPNAQTTNTEATTGAGQTNNGPGGTGGTSGTTTATGAGQTPGANAQDIRSQAEQQREQVRKDMEIEAFQERTGFPLYDPFEQMPDMVQVTLGRVADGDTVDPVQVKEASDWLYTEYKRLDAMKVADNRTMTIPQIEEIQAEIEGEITLLENEYNQVEQQNQERAAVGESNQQTEGVTATEAGTEVNGASTETNETGEAATTEGQEAPVTQEEGTGPAQETAGTEDQDKLDDNVIAEAKKRGITAPHALRILDKYTPNWRTNPDQAKAFDAAMRVRAAQKGDKAQAGKWSLLSKNPKLFFAVRMINRTFGMLGVKTLILNDSDFNAIHESISGQAGSGKLRNATFDPMTKTIYLKSSNLAQTAFHEIAHPFLDSLRLSDQAAYDAIVERVKSLDAVKPDTRGKSYFQWAQDLYAGKDQSVIDNEAVAEFLADTLSGGVGVSNMLKAEAMQVVNDILKAFGYKGTINKPVTLKFIAENIPNFETIVTQAVANSMILEGEAAEAEGQEMRDQIVGEKARLDEQTRQNKIVAQEMEDAGKDAKTIRMATGWEKGVDGKWRYEVEDGQLKGIAKKDSKDGYGSNFEDKLESILDNEELFKAYPELREVKVIFKPGYKGGSHNQSTNTIKVSAGPDNKLQTLLHEVQHAIQSIEGFSLGSNTMFSRSMAMDSFISNSNSEEIIGLKNNLDKYKSEIERSKDIFNEQKNDLYNKLKGESAQLRLDANEALFVEGNPEKFKSLLEKSQNKLKESTKAFTTSYVFSNEDLSIKEKIEDIQKQLDQKAKEKFSKYNGFELYKMFAGEVEARNVESRMNMAPEQRRNTLLSETEDVNREDQIMRDQMIHQKAQLNEDVRHNLRKARRMEELGVSKDIIWMATGWERGANNKWGYEIQDLKVKKKYSDIESLAPSAYGDGHMLGDVINAPDLFKAYPDLKDIEIAYDDNEYDVTASYDPNGDVIRLGVLAAIDLNSAIAHEVQHAIQKRENFGLAGREEIEEMANTIPGIDITSPYSDVADNSLELVEDVIDDARRDYKTVQDVFNEKRYSRENFFELLRDFLSKEYSIDIPVMKSVDRIIIDNKNYFAGNDMAEANIDALVSDMQERIDNINSDEESDESDIEFANKLKGRIEFIKNNPDKVEFVYKNEPVSSVSKEMLKSVSNGNSSMDMGQLLDEMLDYYSGKVSDKYDVYEKAQPEVEARNVQTRMKMSKKDRAMTPPSRTEDVERDSQIFFGDTMRDQMIPRETLENNQVANTLEQEAIIAAADYMQNSINMDAKATEYAAKSDDVIESDISKPVSITDENSEVVFAFMEAIKRAEAAPDRKFRGKTIPEILIPLSKIATFSGKVMRFMRMLPKFSTKAQSEAMFALIENNGYKLSPAQKTMLSEKIGAARLAVQAVEAAKTAYLNTGTEAARKLMEAEKRKQEKADRDLADTLLPMLPADYLDRFISNMQGNIQAIPSLIANLTSGMEAYPRTLLETTARGIFDFIIGSAAGRPKGSAWATLAGFNPFWKGIRSIPSEMIKTLLYGSDVQLDGSARQYGSRVSAKAMYNAMTNPNMKMRVPGGKVFEVFETKDEIQVREVLSDVKGSLIATYPDPRVAAVEAGKIHGAKAFGNEVWQMKKTERGPIHSSYQKPVVPNQALLDTLLGQAEDEAYMLSTKPDTGHQFYFVTSQIAGITAEALNRVSTLTDNAVRNPLQMARLTEEARRHGMSVDSLVAYAALDETGEFSKHLEYLAKSATYQQDNKVATWISKGEAKMKNWIKGRDNNATRVVAAVLFIMAKSQLLFTKTPLNVLNRMVDVILQGIPSATQSAIYFKDSYLAAQKGDRVKADLYYSKGVNYFAKGFSAWAFNTAAAFILAIPGAVIAGYDSLDDKRKAALEAQRVPPGSINVSAVERSINGESPEWQKGDKILPLRYFGQLGQAILFRANVKTRADVKTEKDASSGNAEAVQDELLTEQLNIISAVPKQAFEFSSMAGVNTLINTINADKGSKWAQWSRGMTQSILAGFGVPATYSKAMENELKQELVDPNSMKNTVMNVGMYRLGIPNPDVFARVDALGFPVRNTAKGNNPLAKADYAPDPLWEKLIKIKEETKDPRVIPSSFRVGTEKVTDMLDIETYELLAKDTDTLNRMRGAYRVTELEKLFNDKTYELTNGTVGSVFDEPDLEVKARMVIGAINEADNMFKPEYKKYLVELSRKAGYPKLEQLEQMLIDDNEQK